MTLWVSGGGHKLFGEGVGDILRIANMDDEEKSTVALKALFNKNSMMRTMLKAVQSHSGTLAKEQRNRELFKETEEGDDVFTKKTITTYNSLSPLNKAAQHHKMMTTDLEHGEEVWDILRSLIAQEGFKKDEPEKKVA